jgi:GntR family transcriptional regulator / MocR family aminotransferase
VPDDWAISGRDLHLDLGRTGRRAALEQALREAVQSGRLAPGTLLPPSRALAGDLGIARNTVAEAYTQLVAEGWLTARQGSGTRVAAPPPQVAAPPPQVSPASPHGESGLSTRRVRDSDTASPDFRHGLASRAPVSGPADSTAPRSGHSTGPAGLRGDTAYSLRAGFPDVAAFPHTEWLAAARTALGRAPSSTYGYADPQGLPELRAALAGYLARTRGVRVAPDRVVVCAGFGQGLWAVAAALRGLGARRVGVESHGLPLHRKILAEAGLSPVGLPVTEAGAELRTDVGLDAVLLTPAHQFPLGTALDAEHRAAFVRWARARGAVLIEDDYDGEFRYDRRPLGAMQALAPGDVVYGGTASKALAPAVGLAWLVPPAHLVGPVVAALTRTGARPAALNQLVLAEFLDSGRYDRHVRRSRLAYRRRRDRLVAALAPTGVRIHGLPAGLHAVVDLPDGRSEEQAVAEAHRRGLTVEGLAAFALAPHDRPPALVVGYATPAAHAFTSTLARLVATLR